MNDGSDDRHWPLRKDLGLCTSASDQRDTSTPWLVNGSLLQDLLIATMNHGAGYPGD